MFLPQRVDFELTKHSHYIPKKNTLEEASSALLDFRSFGQREIMDFHSSPGSAAELQAAFLFPGGTVNATAKTAIKEGEDRQDCTMEDRSEFPQLGGAGGGPNPNHPNLKNLFQMKQ